MKYMNRITLCVSLCMLALFCSCDEEGYTLDDCRNRCPVSVGFVGDFCGK